MTSKELAEKYRQLNTQRAASEEVADALLKEYKDDLAGITDKQIVDCYANYVYQIFFF